jgi:hypothetical protein
MRKYLKYFAFLLIFFLVVNSAGTILTRNFNLIFTSGDLFALSLSFAAISLVTLVIYFRGREREEKEQAMHTFVAIGTKFLLELFLALAWFLLAKKSSMTYMILFFVLYLSFSIISIGFILKTLKNKPL